MKVKVYFVIQFQSRNVRMTAHSDSSLDCRSLWLNSSLGILIRKQGTDGSRVQFTTIKKYVHLHYQPHGTPSQINQLWAQTLYPDQLFYLMLYYVIKRRFPVSYCYWLFGTRCSIQLAFFPIPKEATSYRIVRKSQTLPFLLFGFLQNPQCAREAKPFIQ